jgi:hypothetical protein
MGTRRAIKHLLTTESAALIEASRQIALKIYSKAVPEWTG